MSRYTVSTWLRYITAFPAASPNGRCSSDGGQMRPQLDRAIGNFEVVQRPPDIAIPRARRARRHADDQRHRARPVDDDLGHRAGHERSRADGSRRPLIGGARQPVGKVRGIPTAHSQAGGPFGKSSRLQIYRFEGVAMIDTASLLCRE